MADDEMAGGGGGDGDRLAGSMGKLNERTKDLSTGANAFAKAITSAFAQGVTGANSFDTVLKSLALRLSSLSLNLALKPLTNSLASGFEQLFSGLSNAFTDRGGTGGIGASIVPHAKGGVIASPSYFPIGDGRTGLAGEAGPEAVMPLARGPDGRLGVAAAGGGAANVTVNIATPDAESFRRSDIYLTGLIARAVSRGQRGM